MAGRFAPSPTGPLHLGSLLAATASYLDAHASGQQWLLRIDDLDVHRNVAGAEDAIMGALDAHGLHWDGPVIRQSERLERYESALQSLVEQDAIFYCQCSRRLLKGQTVYPGTCRARTHIAADCAIRVKVRDTVIGFEDGIQGHQRDALAVLVGDFVVRRRDGLIAYQLATAVDDGSSLIDSVVRGADLLDNTSRQLYLMQLLGLTAPAYAHVPMLTHPDGSKLSKQTFADPVDNLAASDNLARTFAWLGLALPADASRWSCTQLVAWGVDHWRLAGVPRVAALTLRA